MHVRMPNWAACAITHSPSIFHSDHGFMYEHVDRLVLEEDENFTAEGKRF